MPLRPGPGQVLIRLPLHSLAPGRTAPADVDKILAAVGAIAWLIERDEIPQATDLSHWQIKLGLVRAEPGSLEWLFEALEVSAENVIGALKSDTASALANFLAFGSGARTTWSLLRALVATSQGAAKSKDIARLQDAIADPEARHRADIIFEGLGQIGPVEVVTETDHAVIDPLALGRVMAKMARPKGAQSVGFVQLRELIEEADSGLAQAIGVFSGTKFVARVYDDYFVDLVRTKKLMTRGMLIECEIVVNFANPTITPRLQAIHNVIRYAQFGDAGLTWVRGVFDDSDRKRA